MRARIKKEGPFYVGQVYGTWERYVLGINVGGWTGWNTVTGNCCTKTGVKIALQRWKNKNVNNEFEL